VITRRFVVEQEFLRKVYIDSTHGITTEDNIAINPNVANRHRHDIFRDLGYDII
jgi:hypothetical protein